MSTIQDKLLKNPYRTKKPALTWRHYIAYSILLLPWPVSQIIPMFFGLRWIPGWPSFFMYLAAPLIGLPFAWLLLRAAPKTDMNTQQKRYRLIGILVAVPIFFAAATIANFSRYPKTVEYLHSPNRVNTAVVLEEPNKFYHILKEYIPTETETNKTVYPVRAWVFYEKEQRAGLITGSESVKQTYRWVDDNTLEFIMTVTSFDGIDPLTTYINW